MSKLINEKKEKWSKYLYQQDKVFDFIYNNTEELDCQTKNEYIRKIRYASSETTLKLIEEKLNELEKLYKEINENKKLHHNFPIILKNAENINVIVNPAIKSLTINRLEKEKLDKILDLTSFYIEDNYDNDETAIEHKRLQEKYKLLFSIRSTSRYSLIEKKLISGKEFFIGIKYKDLLELANANKLQVHISTGNQYILNIRKIGENRAKRYKYGFIILDKKVKINNANKEAKRIHSLKNTLEKYEFPFPIRCNIYIKEKKI